MRSPPGWRWTYRNGASGRSVSGGEPFECGAEDGLALVERQGLFLEAELDDFRCGTVDRRQFPVRAGNSEGRGL